jgi:hypothetical protein
VTRRFRILGLLVLLLTCVTPAQAIFVNGGFENGNFTGWTKSFGINPGLSGSPPYSQSNIQISPGGADHSVIVSSIVDPRAPDLKLPR